jgi:hypothetical protein
MHDCCVRHELHCYSVYTDCTATYTLYTMQKQLCTQASYGGEDGLEGEGATKRKATETAEAAAAKKKAKQEDAKAALSTLGDGIDWAAEAAAGTLDRCITAADITLLSLLLMLLQLLAVAVVLSLLLNFSCDAATKYIVRRTLLQ